MLSRFANFILALWHSSLGKCFVFLLVIIYILLQTGVRNDLDIFLAASADLWKGQNIYATTYFEGYHYYYSVFFATCITFLNWVNPSIAKIMWMLASIFMLCRIWKIVFQFLKIYGFNPAIKAILSLLLFIFCLRFIHANLRTGQVTVLIILLTLEALYRIQKGQSLSAAFMLGLAINIKILPIVFIPYLLYRREWKVAILTLGFMALLYFIPSLWLGLAHNNLMLYEWAILINPLDNRHIMDVEETSFHSLTTLLTTLLIENLHEKKGLQTPRNMAHFSIDQLHYAITIARAAFICFTLWFLRSFPFRKASSQLNTFWEFSYILLIVPLIFPHQQHYAFLFSLPAIAYLLAWLINNEGKSGKYRIIIFLTAIIYLSFNLSLLLGVFNAWYNHYKILTYGAILLIVTIASIPPPSLQLAPKQK